MPRQLKEIRNFNLGTILNLSEKDIPEDAAAYSLNVDPLSENGILNSIKTDKLFFTTNDTLSTVGSPISWNTKAGLIGSGSSATQGDLNPTHAFNIENVHIFKNKASARISFLGTNGIKETLVADDIQPWYEKVKAEALTMTFVPSSNITDSNTSFTYLTDTNTITNPDSIVDTVLTISGFTDGTATLTSLILTDAATTLAAFDGKDIVITSPDGRIVTYEFGSGGDEGASTHTSGSLTGAGKTLIQLNGETAVTGIADEIEKAIEHANGHAGLITVSRTDGVLTLTYVASPIRAYLKKHDYITFTDSSASSGAFATTHEIMQITDIDSDSNTIFVERGCFGTSTLAYTTSVTYNVYSNRQTIDGIQLPTNRATCQLSGWSNYSGNNIGGNGHFLVKCDNDDEKEEFGGRVITSATNQGLTVSSSAKTFTFGSAITDLPFSEGDIVTVYSNADNFTNNGFSSKIIKKTTSPAVLTFEDAPVDETESTDTLYFESNILKNHTLHHSVNQTGVTVASDEEYKINAWRQSGYQQLAASAGIITNIISGYTNTTTDAKVLHITAGGGYWETSDGNIDLSAVTDRAENFYPFTANDSYIKLTTEYLSVVKFLSKATVALSSDSVLELTANAGQFISANDILKIGSEYMKVMKVENKNVTVERGILSSTIAVHSASTLINKCVNTGIEQSISKEKMKPGQSYKLSFYAKNNDDAGTGAVSIKFNGGYIKPNGYWTKGKDDLTLGYGSSITDIQQEDRWIDFEDLVKPNNDSGSSTTLDNIWRKLSFTFYCPNVKFSTDIEIQIGCRGVADSLVLLDLFDLSQNTLLYNPDKSSLLSSSSYIDNSGSKDLVSYDSKEGVLKIVESVFDKEKEISSLSTNHSMSDEASENIVSSNKSATMVANNRELHMGFGSGEEDTSPQWLGYVNHTIFGDDYSNEIYQDEDTVHTYDEGGTGTLSKVCLAGEHEKLVATWHAGNADLTIDHTAHNMNVGDNIIVREWMDSNNNWDGNGVWIVESKTDNAFICVRAIAYDAIPSVASGSLAFDTNNDGTKNNAEGLISYRPYFYYGIKDGDSSIYRIWPDSHINESLAVSTTYTKGKIERSLPIAVGATSITTCYNKKADGTGGGRVYILSSISNEIYSYNVELKYDEWEDTPLVQISNMDLAFKSFKWSNDNINGNIGGDTEVFGGLADESSPTIEYAGKLSDILETKGTNKDFEVDATANTSVDTEHFDTRLWIQCRHIGEAGFSEGDRFLFCARTEDGNTDGPDVLYCADRTPPTTVVLGQQVRAATSGHGFRAGPGNTRTGDYDGGHTHLPTYANNGQYAYFYHYFDDDDSKRKLSRLSVYSTFAGENNGTGGAIQRQSHKKPYINFGYNVGWHVREGMPSIKVAKYGIFQVADNDGDGVLDGTGVVTATDKSITDSTNLTGPYGTLHQRVCSHAVGMIGEAGTQWWSHWGKFHGAENIGGNDDYFVTRYGDGPHEDAPERLKTDKCIFISSDTHYGDHQPLADYTCNAAVGYGDTELVTPVANRDMTADGGYWTDSAGCTYQADDDEWDISISSGAADESVLTKASLLTAGVTYSVTFEVNNYVAGSVRAGLGTTYGTSRTADGTYTELIVAQNTGFTISTNTAGASDQTFSIDNISILETGQTTLTSTEGVVGLEVGDTVSIDAAPAQAGVITDVDRTNDKFRVAIPFASFSGSSWNVRSHSIHRHINNNDTSILGNAGVIDSEIMFHYSYDEDDPSNGDIFTKGTTGDGAASGHFTRTYFTPPSYWGGPKTNSYLYNVNPGYVWPIEKFSFRNGVMMRPFDMEDEAFSDLMLGNGIYVDLPAWPNPVYHVANSTKLHNDIGNSSPNNSFASKLFITCPILGDTEQKSKVYMCDLNFMYPSESLQQEEEEYSSSGSTNTWNSGTSWDVCLAGSLGSSPYDTTNAATDLEGNNADQPTITFLPANLVGNNTDIFGASTNHFYRSVNNVLYGLCLSVMDATTGTVQTRYIIGSKPVGTALGDGIIVKVHAPFGHDPASGDKFWIWKHSQAATAPVRMMKTTTLRHGLGDALDGDPTLTGPIYKGTGIVTIADNTSVCTTTGNHGLSTGDKIKLTELSSESIITNNGVHQITVTGPTTFTADNSTIPDTGGITGVWSLLDDSDSSNANPLTVTLSRPLISTHFGGLDMRKTKTHPVTATADDTANIALTSASHLLTTGDSVTFKTEVIIATKNRDFSAASDWVGWAPSTTLGGFGDDASPEYLEITGTTGTAEEGAELPTGNMATIQNTQTYRISADMWCASGTIATYKMEIGNGLSDVFTINTTKTRYTNDITATGSQNLRIYNEVNSTVEWYIDNVSVQCISQDGVYTGTNAGTNTIDIANPDFSVDTDGTLFTNQWEMLIAGTTARSEMGELRAGFTQWDKGNIAGNIQRHDSILDSDRFLNYGESAVKIEPTSLANQSGDYFLKNTRYYYKVSFIYDGYQEGPLSVSYWSHYDTGSRAKLSISLIVSKYSRRLSHVCLYRKDNINDFYKLVKEIPTKHSWNTVDAGYQYTFGDEGRVGATYEARTGMPEIIDTIKLKYGISTEIDGYLFAGDCSHTKIDNASNLVFRSKPGMYSIFDYINDYVSLKSKPTALANFNGRLYAFDNKNIYRINPQTLVIEDTFEGVGCTGKDSVIVTEYGMFFADRNGAYMHNGQNPIKISESIQKGGNTEDSFGGTDNVRDVSWSNVVTNVPDFSPYVIFDSDTASVLFNVEYRDTLVTDTTGLTITKLKQFVWSFSITQKRWDLWELAENSEIGKPFSGEKGEIFFPIGDAVYEYRGGSSNRDYTWISKKLTMNEDSIVKVFNKVKVNGLTNNLNLGGSYIDSSDRLLIKTSTGDIASANITHSSSASGFSDYKLSGDNKKGRWLQFKAENITKPIDSFGILFRRKSTK